AIWKNQLLFVIHNRMERAKFNLASDWRVAPKAPLTAGVNHGGLANVTMPKMGPGEF
ncbi:MAG: peptidase protein, partial [Burkholderia sp.]|nr:peptidase protein [Burkholderia sp.]